MSRDNKRKYLSAYIPEVTPKETPKRDGRKSDGRYAEIEAAVAALSDMMAKQNRDNLDAMYNIDMDNMSSSMRRLFQSYDDGITKANTEIKAWADEMEAGFSAVAQWQKTVEDGTISSIASIDAKADANGASISQLAQWQKTADEEIDGLVSTTAVIKAEADANGASITQIVEAIGEDGEVTFASIAAGVSKDESFINLIAENINLEGYVTVSSLEGNGTATINGNNVSLILDGELDDGETDVESKSALSFIYEHYRSGEWQKKEFAKIHTSIAGDDSDETSRYALNIDANKFINDLGETVYASLKMDAAGRVSIKGQYGMYLGTYGTSGYITLDAIDNTRINANKTFSSASNSTAVAATDYSFNTDGIYYGSKMLVSSAGGSVAVFG